MVRVDEQQFLRFHTPADDAAGDHSLAPVVICTSPGQALGSFMPTLLHAPRTELMGLLDAYATEFEWHCFCLACGHAPPRGHDALQSLYQAQARWRGSRMGELYPLVCAHWDVVNLANELSQVRTEVQRVPVQQSLREAKARHRGVVQGLRAGWQAG
jgi:hypothetical protein